MVFWENYILFVIFTSLGLKETINQTKGNLFTKKLDLLRHKLYEEGLQKRRAAKKYKETLALKFCLTSCFKF